MQWKASRNAKSSAGTVLPGICTNQSFCQLCQGWAPCGCWIMILEWRSRHENFIDSANGPPLQATVTWSKLLTKTVQGFFGKQIANWPPEVIWGSKGGLIVGKTHRYLLSAVTKIKNKVYFNSGKMVVCLCAHCFPLIYDPFFSK